MSANFDQVKAYYKSQRWNFQTNEARERVEMTIGTPNLNGAVVTTKVTKDVLVTVAVFPFKVPPPKRAEVADYLTRANYSLLLGNFEMDLRDGEIRFKSAHATTGTPPPIDVIERAVDVAPAMLNRYAPGLMRVIFGDIAPEDAIREIEGDDDDEADLESLLERMRAIRGSLGEHDDDADEDDDDGTLDLD